MSMVDEERSRDAFIARVGLGLLRNSSSVFDEERFERTMRQNLEDNAALMDETFGLMDRAAEQK